MEKRLTDKFFEKLKKDVIAGLENDTNKSILNSIDWEEEANRCYTELTTFFKELDLKRLANNDIESIGVVDICWNEQESYIEVDFMPDNEFEMAFDEGCIMNDCAIDNNDFFETHFEVEGASAWDELGDDYLKIITVFEYIIEAIIADVAQSEEFKRLPLKSPYHFGFAGFHDEERVNILTIG